MKFIYWVIIGVNRTFFSNEDFDPADELGESIAHDDDEDEGKYAEA